MASRRKAEEWIELGQVTVNGRVAKLGEKADPDKDVIKVAGKRFNAKPSSPLYFALNKPKGCISTTHDPEGRRTVLDLLPQRYRTKVYPVGRLDYNTEGLLLLTNDGDFANRILAAKSQTPKTYQVKVKGRLDRRQLEQFQAGLSIEGRKTAQAKIRMIKAAENPWYEITLIEGRNRQIRKMFQRQGCIVEKIKRIRVGPLALGKLPLGKSRPLTEREVEKFRQWWK